MVIFSILAIVLFLLALVLSVIGAKKGWLYDLLFKSNIYNISYYIGFIDVYNFDYRAYI